MAVADHVQYGEPAPPELRFVNRVKLWGNPTGGGWLDWDAGMIDRATIVHNVYHAFLGYMKAGSGKAAWSRANPSEWRVVSWVIAERFKQARLGHGN